MIKKISTNEYMKRYANMSASEKDVYESRVGEWLSSFGDRFSVLVDSFNARVQNIQAISAMWNDDECRSFEYGTKLLSAMIGTEDTWLPELFYAKSARRSVMNMLNVLSIVKGVHQPAFHPSPAVLSSSTDASSSHVELHDSVAVPVRPNHIDQYVHLLPASTQEKAAKVKGLLSELDYAREKARLLMGAPQASNDERAAWASKAAKTDAAVKSIYRELDAEWDKLVKSGRVVVDDLGNALVLPSQSDSAPSFAFNLTTEQKAQRRELRKFLVDTRRGNGKKRGTYVAKWCNAWKEYMTLEPLSSALEDEKIRAAMAHYGISVDESGAVMVQDYVKEND